MKRNLLIFAIFAAALTVQAQKRLVLVEEFTNTGCGPCASWSPVLDSALFYRMGECIAIKYHSSYPDRNDPFYLYDQETQQAKVDFYHVTGVPATFIDGQELENRSFGNLNAAISYCLMQPVAYDLKIEKSLVDHHLDVKTVLTPQGNVANENLRLFVAVIEEHIEADKPYSNGERELNYTMRKMLTPSTGYQPGTELTAGTAYEYSSQWDIDFLDDEGQLGVVAFLQDISTREMMVTAYSGPKAEGENCLTLLNVFDTPDLICVPEFHGKAILRNDGANPITSATLNVKVNGSVAQYPWTGHLDYLDRDTVSFGDFTNFQLAKEGMNTAEVWFSGVNGTAAKTDSRSLKFSNSVQANYGVRLRIYTDKKPEETTWKLYDSQGQVVRQGGPYQETRKFVTEDFNLHKDDCYQLEFLDAGGDGIKGAYGNGYYQLFELDAEGKTQRLTQGDYTGSSFLLNFNLKNTPAPEKRRLVLFEEFTNTSCDPCADFSPSLDKTIYQRMGQMVAITYHWNFPSNQDPFFLNNPDDVLARANLYGITGVPALFVDGEHVGAYGYEQFLNYYVDGAREIEPYAELSAEASIQPSDNGSGILSLKVSALPTAYTSLDSNLRLFSAIVEERVEWDKPAANGERSWNYVMRKLLPSASGQPLPTDQTQVTPSVFEYSWPISGFANDQELGIVTFLQDMNTKKILNATYTPMPTGQPQGAKILKVMNMPDRICTPQFTADLMVRNIGAETLKSCVVNVSINGQVQSTVWNGQLEPLAIDTLRIPEFSSFTLTDDKTNDVEIWLSNLNDNTEAESAHRSLLMTNAYKAQNAVRLTLMTDQKPEETSWVVLNSAGDVVCQGGPYQEARKKIVVDLPLDVDDCYMLEIEDTGGDGITGDYGRGYYMLHEVDANGKTRLLVQDTFSDALHDVFFSLQNAMPSAIQHTESDKEAAGRSYDLSGRPAHSGSHIIINKGNIIINK